MNKKLLLPLFFAIATTAGCSLAPYKQPPEDAEPATQSASQESIQAQAQLQTTAEKPRTKSGSDAPSPSVMVKTNLYQQHLEWKGTRYQLGGMSKRGVDCSALVYLTYRDLKGIELPRTTEEQARAGKAIERGELRPGDLVFFNTGRQRRHVGIYIEDGKFFHASTSKGVTISDMADHYWKNRYWRARRLDLDKRS